VAVHEAAEVGDAEGDCETEAVAEKDVEAVGVTEGDDDGENEIVTELDDDGDRLIDEVIEIVDVEEYDTEIEAVLDKDKLLVDERDVDAVGVCVMDIE
jgi:hypothetical protein